MRRLTELNDGSTERGRINRRVTNQIGLDGIEMLQQRIGVDQPVTLHGCDVPQIAGMTPL